MTGHAALHGKTRPTPAPSLNVRQKRHEALELPQLEAAEKADLDPRVSVLGKEFLETPRHKTGYR